MMSEGERTKPRSRKEKNKMKNINNIPATENEIKNETAEELKKNIETLDKYLKEIKADHGEDRQAELLKAWHESHLAGKKAEA